MLQRLVLTRGYYVGVSLSTPELHAALVSALGGSVRTTSDLGNKPLLLDLDPPLPSMLRVYLYNLVDPGGVSRTDEYKAVLRVRGHSPGEERSFECGEGRLTVLMAYREDLDVFVLWDAALHPTFTNALNIQVKAANVLKAAVTGTAEQVRRLNKVRANELVLLCDSARLPDTLDRRISTTGGV